MDLLSEVHQPRTSRLRGRRLVIGTRIDQYDVRVAHQVKLSQDSVHAIKLPARKEHDDLQSSFGIARALINLNLFLEVTFKLSEKPAHLDKGAGEPDLPALLRV